MELIARIRGYYLQWKYRRELAKFLKLPENIKFLKLTQQGFKMIEDSTQQRVYVHPSGAKIVIRY